MCRALGKATYWIQPHTTLQQERCVYLYGNIPTKQALEPVKSGLLGICVFKRTEFPVCPFPLWRPQWSGTPLPACWVSWNLQYFGKPLSWFGLSQPKSSKVTVGELTPTCVQTIWSQKPSSLGCQAKNISIYINCTEEFQPWNYSGNCTPCCSETNLALETEWGSAYLWIPSVLWVSDTSFTLSSHSCLHLMGNSWVSC